MILVQIMIMGGVLVFIIFFRDTIGSGAGQAFDTVVGTEDIEIDKPESARSDDESSPSTSCHGEASNEADAGKPDTSSD